MSKEHKIIEYLKEDQHLSQRKIAEKTGLSLGMVNILLQKMVKKGLIKIERLNARSLRYILTPKGIAEKTRLTYKYVKNSYEYVLKISFKVREISNKAGDLGIEKIYLYGPQNEVYHIIKLAFNNEEIKYSYISDLKMIEEGSLVIVWELTDEQKLAGNYNVINLLKIL